MRCAWLAIPSGPRRARRMLRLVAILAVAAASGASWLMACSDPRPARLGEPESPPYLFHESGWMDPADVEHFHGRALRAGGYPFESCAKCHGADFSGGIAQVSCNDCHTRGVKDCSTCHGSELSSAPPKDLDSRTETTRLGVGAHRAHVTDGPLHAAYGCDKCHLTPSLPEDDGHYLRGGAPDPAPAEVALRSGGAGQGAWEREQATCSNGYCHAPAADARATNQTPHWTSVGSGEATCGSCHGLPPASHQPTATDCSTCHRPAFQAGTLNPAKHANGVVDLSFEGSGCIGCHGSGTSAAPPVDLAGNFDESARGVGAHRAHLEARHHLATAVACSECHVVPATLNAPGHIDSTPPAEVFPPGAGMLARARGADAGYDVGTASCTTYCHGAGGTIAGDPAASNQRPVWTGGTNQAGCGTCHGVPPRTAAHAGVTGGLTQCVQCHPDTVTAGGAILFGADGGMTSAHIDGVVQVRPP